MDAKLLLVKSLTLLFRESQLADRSDNSSDLVRTVLENVKVSEIAIGLNTDREIILALKATILEMCNAPQDHVYDKDALLQRVKVNTGDNEKLYEAIVQGIDDELSEASVKRRVVNIRKTINNHFKEQQIESVLNSASLDFKFNREKIKDINQFITDVIAKLEPLQMNNGAKDPAVLNDLDLGDDSAMKELLDEMQKYNNGDGLYRTGWKAFDRMTQGGIRPGSFTIMNALQHKYKTGSSLSLFMQIALMNKPKTKDPNKKPLLLRITGEDEMALDIQFMYQYLKYDETRERVDIKDVSVDEMAMYIKARLQVNGFNIKLIRVDPTQWTYKSIFNKVIELEAQGYNIEVVLMDYLAQVPTIGCVNTGPMGTDLRDLFRRVRNFFAAKRIAFITPHQLSSDAKQLIRNGVPEDQFVKEIAEKGYTSGSKQLDQEVDLEIYQHIFKHNGKWYISFMRGKHRVPTIIENDSHKYFLLEFPFKMPIPSDREDEDRGLSRLPSASESLNNEYFSLG